MRTHPRMYMHAGGCTFAVWESTETHAAAEKGGHMSGNGRHPLRVGVPVGIHIQRHSPFPIHFLPRVGFFSVASSCLRAYDAAPSPAVYASSPLLSRLPFGVRHPASCRAQRFLFQIFSISIKREREIERETSRLTCLWMAYCDHSRWSCKAI